MKELTLGELIRTARVRRGWTQEDLANRLGVKDSYVSQWETGARKWPQEYIRPLAEALSLSQLDMAIAAGLIDRPSSEQPPMDERLAEVAEWLATGLTDEAFDAMRLIAEASRARSSRRVLSG